MDIKKYMNEDSGLNNGNVAALLCSFTEQFLLMHTNLSQPLDHNIKNDLLADSTAFVLSQDYQEAKDKKTDWDD